MENEKINEMVRTAKSNLKHRGELRDMRPYTGLLYSIVKYFRAGADINIFEIGVRRGISTRALLEGLRDRLEVSDTSKGNGKLYSVDITEREHVIKDKELKKKWEFIYADSTKLKWSKEIDILFIDGNHSYKYCKADYERYEPFVRKGGLILLHDLTHPRYGVKDFWKEIKYSKVILPLNLEGMGIVFKD